MLGEPENQFSLTRAALSTRGGAKSNFLSAVEVGLLDPLSKMPKVKVAIESRAEDGWYRLGTVAAALKTPTKSP